MRASADFVEKLGKVKLSVLFFKDEDAVVSDPDKLIPCDGVYAVRVCVEGKEYGGMLSIGYRPTLENGPDRSIEVHIFRFDADIYQQPMRLSFVRRTRPELKFDSIEELIAQLHRDEVEIKSILSL